MDTASRQVQAHAERRTSCGHQRKLPAAHYSFWILWTRLCCQKTKLQQIWIFYWLLFVILESGNISSYKIEWMLEELNREGWFCRQKRVEEGRSENKKQAGHFKVTFLVKVKAEQTFLSCQIKLACLGIWLSLSLSSSEYQVNNLVLAWWHWTSAAVILFWFSLLGLGQELSPN